RRNPWPSVPWHGSGMVASTAPRSSPSLAILSGGPPSSRSDTERMSLLDTIHGPEDLKRLDRDQLPELAAEIRARLIDCCSVTGGHIGASLGVVELSI